MVDELNIPNAPEVEWRMMRIHQTHLTDQMEAIKLLLDYQERELLLIWGCIGLLGVSLLIFYFTAVRKDKNDKTSES